MVMIGKFGVCFLVACLFGRLSARTKVSKVTEEYLAKRSSYVTFQGDSRTFRNGG